MSTQIWFFIRNENDIRVIWGADKSKIYIINDNTIVIYHKNTKLKYRGMIPADEPWERIGAK